MTLEPEEILDILCFLQENLEKEECLYGNTYAEIANKLQEIYEHIHYQYVYDDDEDCAPVLFKNLISHRSYERKRIAYPQAYVERAFALEWEREASEKHSGADFLSLFIDRYTQREASCIATMIQWLGTNCGRCFLDRVYKRANEDKKKSKEKEDKEEVFKLTEEYYDYRASKWKEKQDLRLKFIKRKAKIADELQDFKRKIDAREEEIQVQIRSIKESIRKIEQQRDSELQKLTALEALQKPQKAKIITAYHELPDFAE